MNREGKKQKEPSLLLFYNLQQNRIGHVFQDRYRSEIITDDKYLLQVIRYVHNNPVNAKIVKSPENYIWSSYTEYINENIIIRYQQKRFILGYFSDNQDQFAEFHRQKMIMSIWI